MHISLMSCHCTSLILIAASIANRFLGNGVAFTGAAATAVDEVEDVDELVIEAAVTHTPSAVVEVLGWCCSV